ncbi:HSP20-like chaperone [Talaromyces proteolyticus]|uniref:HSP20-like chaperone n=1 Tax=Talaromyces proteolyticus TaxID=1131652 RepID=A0AAD4PT32_9EURO|nr:HSP20-like chaperone [Talaromyces proteolyticus]KAH8690114.1 HSP20-like chaperone [Talaromyces proteolyticus]
MIFRGCAAPKATASRRLSSSQPYHITRRTITPQRSISIVPRSFFPPSQFTSSRGSHGGEFSSLFRLLDDYTDHITHRFNDSFFQGERPNQVTGFAPNFDIRETDDAYHLDGDVPGIEKDGLQIEFVDEKTLQIKGRTERSFSSGNPPAESTTTVTDVNMGDAAENTNEPAAKTSDTTDATETTKAVAQPAESTEVENNNERYWVSERSVGEFSRTFSFPSPIDQDAVKASLKNGVLSITVPKKVNEEAVRRITIE